MAWARGRAGCLLVLGVLIISGCSSESLHLTGLGDVTTQAAGAHSIGSSKVGGAPALRFEVRPGDIWKDGFKDSSRAEVSYSRMHDTNNTRHAYKFDVLVPSEVNGRPNGVGGQIILAQWHPGKAGNSQFMVGWPTAALYFSGGKLWVSVILLEEGAGMPKQVALQEIRDFQLDAWRTFEFSVVWSQKADGRVRVLSNGEEVLDYNGPNGYYGTHNYFKFGIYRINDVYAPTTVMYFKGVRRE